MNRLNQEPEKYLRESKTIASKIKRKLITFLPRKFHCFCIGAEKTGTTSIHHMFKNNYRSSHEPDVNKTVQLCIDYLEGEIPNEKVKKTLRKRDNLLNLEMESAHHLVYLSDFLVDIFPEAKFIITIRDPYRHLNSRLNWHLHIWDYGPWKNYMNYFIINKHESFKAEETFLKKLNLFSLETLLSHYADHYNRIDRNIPAHRCLFIRTNELNNSHGPIASFLNINKSNLQHSHALKNKSKIDLLGQLDEKFVRRKIWNHCSDIIKKFFPEQEKFYSNIT